MVTEGEVFHLTQLQIACEVLVEENRDARTTQQKCEIECACLRERVAHLEGEGEKRCQERSLREQVHVEVRV